MEDNVKKNEDNVRKRRSKNKVIKVGGSYHPRYSLKKLALKYLVTMFVIIVLFKAGPKDAFFCAAMWLFPWSTRYFDDRAMKLLFTLLVVGFLSYIPLDIRDYSTFVVEGTVYETGERVELTVLVEIKDNLEVTELYNLSKVKKILQKELNESLIDYKIEVNIMDSASALIDEVVSNNRQEIEEIFKWSMHYHEIDAYCPEYKILSD